MPARSASSSSWARSAGVRRIQARSARCRFSLPLRALRVEEEGALSMPPILKAWCRAQEPGAGVERGKAPPARFSGEALRPSNRREVGQGRRGSKAPRRGVQRGAKTHRPGRMQRRARSGPPCQGVWANCAGPEGAARFDRTCLATLLNGQRALHPDPSVGGSHATKIVQNIAGRKADDR